MRRVSKWPTVCFTATAGRRAKSTGRRNTLITEVSDGTTEEADAAGAGRGATAMGCGQGDAGADAFARSPGALTPGGATRVLAAALGRLTPVEYELIMSPTAAQAAEPKLSPVRAADPTEG